MKPARFRYLAPDSLEAALAALSDPDGDIRILAGGQSLGPLLNLRLARPDVILDVNRIPDLDAIRVTSDGQLSIGALTRQRRAETSAAVSSGWSLLCQAISQIGHRAIRNRGTVGGSVAHADPAAELPAALTALDATFHVASVGGRRSVPAAEFFRGPLATALDPDEMLLGLTVPPTDARAGQAWLEFSRRRGDFGVIGVAAVLRLDEDHCCADVRLVYSGADWTPWEPPSMRGVLNGRRPAPGLFEEVGRAVAGESAPPADIHASAAQRRRLIRVLTARVLARCAADVTPAPEGSTWD